MKLKEFRDFEIYNKVKDILSEYSSMSFSWYARTYKYTDDIEEIENDIENNGIDINKFFQDYKDEILEDNFFVSCCGVMDYLLYKYIGKEYPLSGDLLIEWEDDSKIIKYQYNFDKYYLGKLYIEQSYGTIGDFYFDLASNSFPREIYSSFSKRVKKSFPDDIISENHGDFSISKFELPLNIDNSDFLQEADRVGIGHSGKIGREIGYFFYFGYVYCIFGDDEIFTDIESIEGVSDLCDEYLEYIEISKSAEKFNL